jgi:hypothetical protein
MSEYNEFDEPFRTAHEVRVDLMEETVKNLRIVWRRKEAEQGHIPEDDDLAKQLEELEDAIKYVAREL